MFLIIDLASQEAADTAVRDQDAPQSLEAFGRRYAELTLPDSEGEEAYLGFYDWLRSFAGEVVGVRLTLHEDRLAYQSALPPREYVRRVHDGIVEIMLVEDLPVDEDESVDQEFVASRIYRAADGSIAMLFDTGALSVEQLARFGSERGTGTLRR
jgi:hypothetical protein